MIRGALSGTTRHKMLGVIDTPLPRLARMTEEFCLQAISQSAAERERRLEGGGR